MYSDLLADENTASKINRSNTLLKTWTKLNFKLKKKFKYRDLRYFLFTELILKLKIFIYMYSSFVSNAHISYIFLCYKEQQSPLMDPPQLRMTSNFKQNRQQTCKTRRQLYLQMALKQ